MRPQKDKSVRLEITFTKEQFEELKQAKSLLSHIAHTGSLAEVISVLARKFNQSKLGKPEISAQNNNPFKRQSEVSSASINKPPVGSAAEFKKAMPANKKRPHISVHLKRKLYSDAQGCCQYENPDGNRCESQFQLQIDHVIPVRWGGKTMPENLRLLCRTHNLLAAEQMGLH